MCIFLIGIFRKLFERKIRSSSNRHNLEQSKPKRGRPVNKSHHQDLTRSLKVWIYRIFPMRDWNCIGKNAGIADEIHSGPFRRRLAHLGFLVEKDGTFSPTGFGILVFGNQPRNVYTRAGMLGTIHYPNGEIETEDFNYPMVLIPEKVREWLTNKLPNVIDRSQMIKQKRPPFQTRLYGKPSSMRLSIAIMILMGRSARFP